MDGTDQKRRTRKYGALVVAGHVLLTAVLAALVFVYGRPGPTVISVLLLVLLTAQSSLLAIWVALGTSSAVLRLLGFAVGLGALSLLIMALLTSGQAVGEEMGVIVEMFVLPCIGTAIVLVITRVLILRPATLDSELSNAIPRISLLGLLTIITVVAVLLGMPPAVSYLSKYDRLSVEVALQSLAFGWLAYLAVWAALGVGRLWPRILIYFAGAVAIAVFRGPILGRDSGPAVLQSINVLCSSIVLLISLFMIRRSGLRFELKSAKRCGILWRASLAAIAAIVGIGLLDFAYARIHDAPPMQVFASEATIDDATGEMRREAIKEFTGAPSAATLTHLLRLNGDGSTVVDELKGVTGGNGTFETIESNNHDYLVAVGRRKASRPPGMREQIAHGTSSDWMAEYSTACFFDGEGHLLGKVGGQLAPDKVNGDDVELTTLGTDRWFAMVDRFEPHGAFSYQTVVHIVEPGFPVAFHVYHYPNTTSWTDTNEAAAGGSYFEFEGLASGRLPPKAKGVGADGQPHSGRIRWDADRKVFTGPSKVTYGSEPSFEIDLEKSSRFKATDR